MSYPKWVSRGFGRGDILCLNAAEEAVVAKEVADRENPPTGDEADDDSGDTVESVRAKLDAAGIAYHWNAGLAKLKALLPAE